MGRGGFVHADSNPRRACWRGARGGADVRRRARSRSVRSYLPEVQEKETPQRQLQIIWRDSMLVRRARMKRI
jgi:hypothetical protein